MQLFSDLRSDYPLNLTLLEHVHACALTWFSPAGLTSARGSPFRSLAPSGGSFRGSLWIVLSTLGITPARMVDIAIRLRPRICTGSRTNFCSSVCAPSARESTCGLTQVRAWVRNFRLHVDAQRTPLVEYRRAHLRGNAELFSRELTARSLSLSQRHVRLSRCTCCPHRDLTRRYPQFFARLFRCKLDGRSALGSVTAWRACSRITGKSDQLRRST